MSVVPEECLGIGGAIRRVNRTQKPFTLRGRTGRVASCRSQRTEGLPWFLGANNGGKNQGGGTKGDAHEPVHH